MQRIGDDNKIGAEVEVDDITAVCGLGQADGHYIKCVKCEGHFCCVDARAGMNWRCLAFFLERGYRTVRRKGRSECTCKEKLVFLIAPGSTPRFIVFSSQKIYGTHVS